MPAKQMQEYDPPFPTSLGPNPTQERRKSLFTHHHQRAEEQMDKPLPRRPKPLSTSLRFQESPPGLSFHPLGVEPACTFSNLRDPC